MRYKPLCRVLRFSKIWKKSKISTTSSNNKERKERKTSNSCHSDKSSSVLVGKTCEKEKLTTTTTSERHTECVEVETKRKQALKSDQNIKNTTKTAQIEFSTNTTTTSATEDCEYINSALNNFDNNQLITKVIINTNEMNKSKNSSRNSKHKAPSSSSSALRIEDAAATTTPKVKCENEEQELQRASKVRKKFLFFL